MTVGEVDEPVAVAGEVVVTVHRVGICGSDVTAYRGNMGIARPGDVRGHEFAGVVTAVADNVDRAWLGRRVAVNAQVTCGKCWACRNDTDNLCPHLQIIGVHRAGAFAERVAVPARNLIAVDDTVTAQLAATAEPLAQACHDVQLVLPAEPRSVLVIGAGSIGNLVVQAARLLGIPEITVVEPHPQRRAAAVAAGAETTVESTDVAAAVAAARPEGGFDVVFDVVGVAGTRTAAVGLARPGGQVVLVGLHTDVHELSWFPVIRREVVLRGANCYDRGDFAQAVAWLHAGEIRPPDTVRHVILDEGPAVFAELASGAVTVAKTYVTPAG
ncbi:alcohol dehydrogenase catalytic domain-containing protein [Modestobacter lapidis]